MELRRASPGRDLGSRYALTERVRLTGDVEWVRGHNQITNSAMMFPGAITLTDLGTYSEVLNETTRIRVGADWMNPSPGRRLRPLRACTTSTTWPPATRPVWPREFWADSRRCSKPSTATAFSAGGSTTFGSGAFNSRQSLLTCSNSTRVSLLA